MTCRFTGARVRSCCELILAGEPGEDRSAANLVAARLITCRGWVSVWAGASCASARCGRAALKWTSATAHRRDGDTWRRALSALELAHPIELNGEFFRASLALFPEHGEPTQCAGSLCCVEAWPVVAIDAEVGFQFVPGVVGDGAGADCARSGRWCRRRCR